MRLAAAIACSTWSPSQHAVELPNKDQEIAGWAIEAEIDPDNTLSERDRSNNAARSALTSSRLPTLQFLTAEVSPEGRAGTPRPLTIAVRNTSTVASSPATELQLEGSGYCARGGAQSWGGGPDRVAVPALAPRQTVTYRMLVPDATRCAVSQAGLTARLDPDRRSHWGQGQEREVRRTYSVR